MVLVLLVWILAGGSTLVWGFSFYHCLTGRQYQGEGAPSLPIYVLAGLALQATLVQAVSLMLPIWSGICLGVLGISVLLAFIMRQPLVEAIRRSLQSLKQDGPWVWVFIGLNTLLFLIKGAGPAEIFDEGAYYLPVQRMTEWYGVVPGFANAHSHFGINSAWIPFNALYSFRWAGLPPLYELTGLVSLAGLALFAGGLGRVLRGSTRPSDWMMGVFPLLAMRNLLTAPVPDVPATIVVFALALTLLSAAEQADEATGTVRGTTNLHSQAWIGLLVLLVAFVISVRITLAPVALGLGALLWPAVWQGRWKPVALAIGLVTFVLAAWMARTAMLTGYLIHPLPELDVLSVDWKVPYYYANFTRSRVNFTAIPDHALHPSPASLHLWWAGMNLREKAMVVAAIFAVPILFFKSLRHTPGRSYRLWLLASLGVGLLGWWSIAPEVRYGLSIIIFLALWLVFALAAPLLMRTGTPIRLGWAILLVVVSFANLARTMREAPALGSIALAPPPYPKVSHVPIQGRNFTMYHQDKYLGTEASLTKPVFIWDSPEFPYTSKRDTAALHIGLRGKTIKEGIRTYRSEH